MDKKAIIDQLQQRKADYKDDEQAQNLFEALSLITSAFSEYIRFLFELIQNADDSSAYEVEIHTTKDYLVISHDGKEFDEADVYGICNVGAGTKKANSNAIGYKGIGFKSVFGKSNFVAIFSNGYQFKFDGNFKHKTHPVTPWQIIPQWIERTELPKLISDYLNNNQTKVCTVIRLDLTPEFLKDLEELLNSTQILLFLRKLKQVSVTGLLELLIKKLEINSGNYELVKNETEISNWIVKTFKEKIDNEVLLKIKNDTNVPPKVKLAEFYEISFAAKVDKGSFIPLSKSESLIFTYLPTKVGYEFPFIINSNFIADTSRELLFADNAWNVWLMKMAGTKLVEWMAELNESEYRNQILNLLPKRADSRSDKLTRSLFDSLDEAVNQISFVPTEGNVLKKPLELIIDKTKLSNLIATESIVEFVNGRDGGQVQINSFVNPNLDKVERLSEYGASKFDKKDLETFFLSSYFTERHSLDDNFKLISFFYEQADLDKNWNEKIEKLNFIYSEPIVS